jgi:hypothetical protein
VQLMAPRSAVLTLRRVTVKDTGHVHCCLPDRPVHTGLYAMQDVTVFSKYTVA